MNRPPWNTVASWYRKEYGEKVYKIPIALPVTCPNRDGTAGSAGCIYCGVEGGSFGSPECSLSFAEQLAWGRKRVERLKAKKFIAYFQNFTNTYLPIEELRNALYGCVEPDIVGMAVSTRPDCLLKEHVELFQQFEDETGRKISVELGLQTVQSRTLKIIRRGHTVADWVRAQLLLRDAGIRSCVHLILNLPWDRTEDVVEAAKLVSFLGVEEVKLHALYVLEGTQLGEMYRTGRVKMLSKQDYIDRVCLFLRHLHPEAVLQRIVGRAPEERTLFCNWDTSWWKLRDEIVEQMVYNEWKQGDLFPKDQGIVWSGEAKKGVNV